MKKLFMCIAICAGIFNTAMADNKDKLSTVISMGASKAEVIELLGEPDELLAIKGQSHWSYNKENIQVKIQWDETTSSIKYLSYESNELRNEKWSVTEDAGFIIDETDFNDVLKKLGMPSSMKAYSEKHQNVKYNFSNYTLTMYFESEKLKRFSLDKV